MRGRLFLQNISILLGLSLSVMAGCESDEGPSRPSSGGETCLPGETKACTCTSGSSGAQECKNDGLGMGPCMCAADGDVRVEPIGDVVDDGVTPDDTVNTDGSADTNIDTPPVGDTILPPDSDGDSTTETGDPDTQDGSDSSIDTDSGPCEPNCAGKQCGGDGCQGSCGVCAADATCSAAGLCVTDVDPADVIIVSAEGQEVIPQTLLHLSANTSHWADGPATQYTWSVDQPELSTSLFLPSKSAPAPTFQVNTAGTYRFSLTVWNAAGATASAATFEVYVIPENTIHIELLWTSPGDPDPTDVGPFAGTDMDLHFTHSKATGPDLDGDGSPDPWFDADWDCFWFHPTPDWGNTGVDADDPSLDRDDTDGAGPENVNLELPEEGKAYAIGVHYWDDHGFGASYATVRVYIYSQLVFEAKELQLVSKDMWWVGSLAWPSGEVAPKVSPAGSHWITHDYNSPFFQ